jgi:hypothetical protein
MTRQFRVELHGPDARLGDVPAGDVARLWLAVERALARQSAHQLQRPAAPTGRWERTVADAARIRLSAIEEGSVSSVLELPDYGVDVPFRDVETLGEVALAQLIDVVSGERQAAADVAAVFVRLADELDLGTRYDTITFDHTNGGGRRVAVLDAPARDRLRHDAEQPAVERPDLVRGTLVEADFERSTARLRTPAGAAVQVTFAPDLADVIEQALRRPAEFAGEVTYDPNTATATAIRLEAVHEPQVIWPGLVTADYRQRQSLADLAASGAIRPVQSPAELRAVGPTTGDDLDAFFAALAVE